jgi:hypothetical protein
MGNKYLQIIKIALTCGELADVCQVRTWEGLGMELTVITPRASKQLFQVWVIPLLLAHHRAGG